jgi:hypothetical protein
VDASIRENIKMELETKAEELTLSTYVGIEKGWYES